MNTTLLDVFRQARQQFATRSFLSMRPRWRLMTWTFQEVHNFAAGLARVLEEHNVQKGDRVILISPNSPYWVGALWAILYRGAIVVPLSPKSTDDFVERIVVQTGAKVVLKSVIITVRSSRKTVCLDIESYDDLHTQQHDEPTVSVSPDDVAEIVYTSGTTGDPKGVVLTHRNICSNLDSICQAFDLRGRDRTVMVLPLFHMYAQTAGLFMATVAGAQVMFSRSVSSRDILSAMQEMRPTKMLVVPELLESIVRKIEYRATQAGHKKLLDMLFVGARPLPLWARRILFRRVRKVLGGSLHLFASGGAALAPEVHEKWQRMGYTVLQGYGLTETSPVVTTNTLEQSRVGSVGKPVKNVEVRIQDKEITVRGPNVFSGYYKQPEKTDDVFDEDGFFCTGDMGYFDEDQFLFISGRKKYVIVTSSGENVYPEDIEGVLKDIDGVDDAAVLGIKTNHQEIIYAVLLGDFDDGGDIIREANSKLAPHQQIQDWAVWPEHDFPRSAIRKVKKEEVRSWIEQHRGEKGASHHKDHTPSPLIQIVAAVSGQSAEHISEDTNLVRDLHFDSLMRIELVSQLEEELNVTFDEARISGETTIKDLQKLIEAGEKPYKQRDVRWWNFSSLACYLRVLLQTFVVFPIYRLRLSVQSRGVEKLNNVNGPVIFMVNHLSFLDALIVVWALPWKWRLRVALAAAVDVLYQEYKKYAPLVEFFFNSYPLPRTEKENIKPGLEATGRILDRGFSIVLFPEGKISVEGTLQDCKKGSGLLAVDMGVPIVPVYLEGVRDVIEPYSVWPHKRGSVMATFGEPVTLSQDLSYDDAARQIFERLAKLS